MDEKIYGWWLPPDVSVHGAKIDQLMSVLHWFMLLLFLGWGIFFVYCLVRFRPTWAVPAARSCSRT